MVELAPDFDEFFESLTAHSVEYLVVGAYALAFHGVPRFTGDIDVFIRPTVENGRRLLAALSDFGFPVEDVIPEQVVDPGRVLQMGVEPVQIHVMSDISGVSWAERGPGGKPAVVDRVICRSSADVSSSQTSGPPAG